MAFVVELDDLHETNEELAEAVMKNTRRYTNMVSDVVYEMLPDFKHKEVGCINYVKLFLVKTTFIINNIKYLFVGCS